MNQNSVLIIGNMEIAFNDKGLLVKILLMLSSSTVAYSCSYDKQNFGNYFKYECLVLADVSMYYQVGVSCRII